MGTNTEVAMAKRKKRDEPQTTGQQLRSLIKSARDIMRKDKGLNGDLDRLPLLTWIMFLKFLDDMERMREDEAALSGKSYRPLIDDPYRWRDWAAEEGGITGPELLAFINQDEAVGPDGKRRAGLFAYLRGLESPTGKGREEVVANVFRGVANRMESGYLLRDVINKGKPGRAAVVVPNGTLFGDGVCARIKEELLKSYNLHTVVRLPNGVFSPYTLIPTNLLFFDRSGPTREIWYYEIPLPEGRKNYTKTKPMQYEEFADCVAWWSKRKQNDQAWKIKAADLLKYDEEGRLVSCNLDLKNPNSAEALEHRPPEELVSEIIEKEQRILEIMQEIQTELGEKNR